MLSVNAGLVDREKFIVRGLRSLFFLNNSKSQEKVDGGGATTIYVCIYIDSIDRDSVCVCVYLNGGRKREEERANDRTHCPDRERADTIASRI